MGCRWASFSGKNTYRNPDTEQEGNYRFVVYVGDHAEPGAGVDRFWIEVQDKTGNFVLSLGQPARINAQTIGGGNIVVLHETQKGKP